MIETRKDEVRFVTDDPKRMLNKFFAENAYHVYTEDFVDESTGEVTSIERKQILFEKGTYIDRDVLSNIMFYIQSGDLSAVTVSSQKRLACEMKPAYAFPFVVTASVGGKNRKFLLYAVDIPNAIEIIKDYIELNYSEGFRFVQIKAFGDNIIIEDTLKSVEGEEKESTVDEDGKDEEAVKPDMRFIQVECKITNNDDYSYNQNFVVHTTTVDKAMILIDLYLQNMEKKWQKEAEEKGRDYVSSEPRASIEAAKPLSVSRFVPREFSDAYIESIMKEE